MVLSLLYGRGCKIIKNYGNDDDNDDDDDNTNTNTMHREITKFRSVKINAVFRYFNAEEG